MIIGGNISPGDTAANHYEECGLAMVLHLFKILVAAWAEGIIGMQLHTGAELFRMETSFPGTVN
jgi:hypothetical protein